MGSHHPSPVRLKTLSPAHRWWLCGFIALGIVFIAVGWFITIQRFSSSVTGVRAQIDQGLETVVNESQEIRKVYDSDRPSIAEAFQALRQGYEEAKDSL